jgi:hypothetical protein
MPILASWTGNSTYTYARVATGPGKSSWLGKIGPTGKPTWKVPLGVVTGGTPIFAYQTLYVPSNRYHPGMIAVRARDGKVLWGADLGQALSLAAANHLIYVLHEKTGRIDILSADSGKEVHHFQTPGYRGLGTGQLLVAGGAVYIVNGNAIVAMGT